MFKKQGQQGVKHRRNRNKVCRLCSHPGNRLLGVLATVGDWSLPAFSYSRHQGSSRIEAKQALQFSNLELTNSQCISLKKKIRHNEIQVSQMIFLMGKQRPMFYIGRRKKANFGQSPSGHWEQASSARMTANQGSKYLPAAQPGLWELQNKGSVWGHSK